MSEKFCSKCKISKDINLFGVDNNSKDGHRRWCKECRNNSKPIIKNTESELKIDKIVDYLKQVLNNQKQISLCIQKLINQNQVDEPITCELSESKETKADGIIFGLTDDDKRFLGLS